MLQLLKVLGIFILFFIGGAIATTIEWCYLTCVMTDGPALLVSLATYLVMGIFGWVQLEKAILEV